MLKVYQSVALLGGGGTFSGSGGGNEWKEVRSLGESIEGDFGDPDSSLLFSSHLFSGHGLKPRNNLSLY
jgi:hypothetical protein